VLFGAYGMPVLGAHEVAAVVAVSMDTLLVRLPQPSSGLKMAGPSQLTEHGWHAVNAWQSDLSSEEGDRRLRGTISGALNHASDLAVQWPTAERA
jgi:hypothetical protein